MCRRFLLPAEQAVSGNSSSTLPRRTGRCGPLRCWGRCSSSGPKMPKENVGSCWLTRPSHSFVSVRVFSSAPTISSCFCRRWPSSAGRPAHGCFILQAVGSRERVWEAAASNLPARLGTPAETDRARAPKAADAGAEVPGILLWPAATMLLVGFGFWCLVAAGLLLPVDADESLPKNLSDESLRRVGRDCRLRQRHTTPDQRWRFSDRSRKYISTPREGPPRVTFTPTRSWSDSPSRCKCSRRCAGKSGRRSRHFWYTFMLPCRGWPILIPAASSMNGLGRYVESYYRPVGLADIVSPTRTDYQWGDQAAHAHPRSPHCIWVFQRKK